MLCRCGYSAVTISRLKNKVDLGTVIVNLCGASSTGKTTAEELLVSAFACPVESNGDGLIRTFHSTQNATFAALEGIHGLPIALSNNYLNLPNLIYTIATGEEKARCTAEGTLKSSNSGWSGLVVVSSETPIQEANCENQGLKARVLQTQGITWTPNAATAELIKKTVRENYGFTGYEFAQYIEQIDIDTLYDRYLQAKTQVHTLMPIRDNLSDRLEAKYAAIYLTVELMNECFALSLNADNLLTIMLAPEQANVVERNIALKGENAIKEFVKSKRQHFNRYIRKNNKWVLNNPCSGDYFGTVRDGNICEVYILPTKVEEILKSANINEPTTVKRDWKEGKLIKADNNRYDCKFNGSRHIHFIFKDGFTLTTPIEIPIQSEPQQDTPVMDINYDDSELIDEIFGDDYE